MPALANRQLRVIAECLTEVLGEVLGEVSDSPVRICLRGDDPLEVQLGPKPDHVSRTRIGVAVQGVQGLLERREHLTGGRVDVPDPVAPDRDLSTYIDRMLVLRPPDLVIRRLNDLPEGLSRYRSTNCGMEVRRQPSLSLDGGEVLHLEPDSPAKVLPEPVHQL